MTRNQYLDEYPFMQGQPSWVVRTFIQMIEDPEIFRHLGQGLFELTDKDAAITVPGVREAVKALNMQDRLKANGNEFLAGLGL